MNSLLALLLSASIMAPMNALAAFQPIKQGDKGQQVYEVEKMLKKLGYLEKADQSFEDETWYAVARFQYKAKLPYNGIVDQKTYKALKAAYTGKADQPKQPSSPVAKPAPDVKPTPAPVPGKSQTPTKGNESKEETKPSELSVDEQRMITLINQERQKAGLKPLAPDMEVTKVARIKAKEMIDKNYFSHYSPAYGSPFDMLRSYGVSYRTTGENIAGNWSIDDAHQRLMTSSGHRMNIMNSAYTHAGIGIVDGGPYGKMFVQIFIGK